MFENLLKNKVASGQIGIGTMLTEIRTPLIIPLLARSGFDFVIVDCEHGTYSHQDLTMFVLAAKATNLTVMARSPSWDYISLAKLWDCGAQGLMIPRIETVEHVQQIIKFSKYPPLGERGYGPRGIITDYDPSLIMEEKTKAINDNAMIILQIEKQKAVEHIEQMIAFPEIDAVIIGPNDLSLSLGVPGDYYNEKFINAVDRVLVACKKRGISCGFHTGNYNDLMFWKEKGMNLVMYSTPFRMLQDFALDFTGKFGYQPM